MTIIGRLFPAAVISKIHCSNLHSIYSVKYTKADLILVAGEFMMKSKPWTAQGRKGCSHKVRVVVNVQGLYLTST